MNKITIYNQEIDYNLKRSRRAKRLRLAVYCDASVVVTLPWRANENIVEKFIREKATWLLQKISNFKINPRPLSVKSNRADYLKNKTAALKFVKERVAEFNKFYHLKFNRIAVKNQKTRWGSCSRKKNLNFNYRLLHLPKHLADYIIVHELCHLQEFNHSRKFWNLVSCTVPNYHKIKEELRHGAC